MNSKDLANKIRSVGLCRDRRNIYGSDKIYESKVSGVGLWQQPDELAEFLVFLGECNVKTGIEIGTWVGSTAIVISEYLKSINKGFHLVTIDPIKRCNNLDTYNIEYIKCTSFELIGKSFDFCFIDSEHTYDSLKRDYENIGKFCKVCAFHDINDKETPEVTKFWNEIKGTNYKEFIHDPENSNRFGIGAKLN